MTAVEIKYRLPRREPPKGDARIGAHEPALPPLIVQVLCFYKFWQAQSGMISEGTGCVLVSVRSSRAILASFTDAMTLEVADWPAHRGPKPRSWEFVRYIPENGRRNF